MGTLGEYLRKAREAKDIDIRDAAQQTRISINYLKALEEEDFVKLPGDVFVKGFLKSYGRFLHLDEPELMRRFSELKPKPPVGQAALPSIEKAPAAAEDGSRRKTPIEPFLWGGVICAGLLVFLFSSMPGRQAKRQQLDKNVVSSMVYSAPTDSGQVAPIRSEKLYLELVAMEDTWLLVRTDTSPQKKAILKKGESLIWSADDRFLLSYGGVGAMKLFLNGEELAVRGSRETPVRDLAVARTGILNQPAPLKQPAPARPKPKASVQAQQAPAAAPVPAVHQTVPVPPARQVQTDIPAPEKPQDPQPSVPVNQQ